jgi:hypothetical protein
MKVIKYYDFFNEARNMKYVSTRQIVDQLLKYEELVNYRMHVVKETRSSDYWFLTNVLDMTLLDTRFYKKLYKTGKELEPKYLSEVLIQLKGNILEEFSTIESIEESRCVSDTLQLIKVWLKVLDGRG